MTQAEIAQAFREIDNLAAVARHVLYAGADRQTVAGDLVAIQLAAQTGLREVLSNTEAEACADCPWDGKTLFPQTQER